MPFKPKQIILQKKAAGSVMAQHVRAAHPDAKVAEIPFATHSWNGKQHSLDPNDHFQEKRHKVAVLSRRATWKPDPNGRSTDFLPNIKLGTGCGFFCQYCYVERGKPNSYPKVYDDALSMVKMVKMTLDNLDFWRVKMQKVCRRKPGLEFERDRDPQHPPYITFDLGCDTDCTIDNQITRHDATTLPDGTVLDAYPGHVIDIMNQITENVPGAMTSFATKGIELDPFIEDCKHPERNRIRLSLMPEWQRRILEMNTATTQQRLEAVNRLVAAGFEVHINLSPIVITESFSKDYRALLKQIDDVLTPEAKAQLAYEVIFLTHSNVMYEPVAARRPKAHLMMAEGPLLLKAKPHKPTVTTYTRSDKTPIKKWLRKRVEQYTPYARIRYMF
jgi:DNA repair photolyase